MGRVNIPNKRLGEDTRAVALRSAREIHEYETKISRSQDGDREMNAK